MATSANKSGLPAASVPAGLDPDLLAGADAAVLGLPWPGGGAPSTLLRLLGGGAAQVLRLGAVGLAELSPCCALCPDLSDFPDRLACR